MVPSSFETAGAADVWPTLWRMYTDTTDNIVFYESATSPMAFWYLLDGFDLGKNGETKMLSLINETWEARQGDMTGEFEKVAEGSCKHIWTRC